MKTIALFITLLSYLAPLASTAQGSSGAKPVVYQLPPAVADSVKQLLKKHWAPLLRDTIIIQYQEEAAGGMVSGNDEIIQQNVTAELRFLHNQLSHRKNISIVQFAADTKENNYLQEFNNLLTIDTGNLLYETLFSKHKAASVILLPGNKCIYFSGAQKWEALSYRFDPVENNTGNDLAKNGMR